MSAEYPYIARQGWPLILVIVVIALIAQVTGGIAWSIVPWLLTGFLIYLFRDPKRSIPPAPLGIVSPVDGEVTAVTETHDPYLDREAIRIRLRMSIMGSYSIRIPTEGKVMKVWSQQIQEKEAQDKTESGAPVDRYAIWVQTDEEDDAVVVIRRFRRLIRPQCYIYIGQRIGQGQRCGMVSFGGGIDVYIPTNSRIQVHKGDKVCAGSDIIATFTH